MRTNYQYLFVFPFCVIVI